MNDTDKWDRVRMIWAVGAFVVWVIFLLIDAFTDGYTVPRAVTTLAAGVAFGLFGVDMMKRNGSHG